MATAVTPPEPGQQLPVIPNQPVANPQEQQRLARLELELAEQRRMTTQLQSQLTRPPAQAAPNTSDLNRQFFQDPVTSAQAIARQAAQEQMQQFGAGHMETLIETCRMQARQGNEEIFDRYANEIEARVAQAGPQFQANINVWKSAVNMVKGEHMRELIDAARQAQPQAPAIHISREGGPAAPSVAGQPAAKAEELTAEEKKMAKSLGIDDDMYRAGKAYNEKQNGDFDPIGASSWDKVVTFDSRQKRREKRRAAQRPAA